MPAQTYEIKDPRDGSVFEVQSDHPPTPEEARTAVAKYRIATAKASGQPTMGASVNIEGRSFPADALDAPPDAVTLGQFVDNPREAMQKIGQIIKQDLTDPKLWGQAALAYFGPKAIGIAGPVLARARAMATPDMMKDLATVGLGDSRVGAGVRIAGRVADAVKGASPAAPPESASGGTPPPAGPPPEPAPAAPPAKSPQQLLNEEAIARRRAEYQARQAEAPKAEPPPVEKPKMTADEVTAYRDLRAKGKTDEQAREVIAAARAINAKYGLKPPTAAEKRFPKGMRGRSSPPES
jgi:hypothetical protein